MKTNQPTVSIITPSFNQGVYIEQTIKSVLRQDYAAVEHIVIDGGSTDSTADVLKRYPHLVVVSEKDCGQADALNKGLALAKGDIIGWINSDDYYQENILASVVRHFRTTNAQWVIGNLANVYDDGSEIVFRRSPDITFDSLARNPDIVRQQATFFRKDALTSVCAWNVDYHMAMDYDLWMRLISVSIPKMVDEDWAFYRNHMAQKSAHGNTLRQSEEISAIQRRERVAPRWIAAHRIKKGWYAIKGVAKSRLIRWGVVPQRYRTRPIRPK